MSNKALFFEMPYSSLILFEYKVLLYREYLGNLFLKRLKKFINSWFFKSFNSFFSFISLILK